MNSEVVLPVFEECEAAVDSGTATELQAFIYNQEPANQTDAFREGLRAVIAEAIASTAPRDAAEGSDWAKEREAIKARVEPPVFTGVVCRGDSALGTACGKCERCLWYQTHQVSRADLRRLLDHATEDERERTEFDQLFASWQDRLWAAARKVKGDPDLGMETIVQIVEKQLAEFHGGRQ